MDPLSGPAEGPQGRAGGDLLDGGTGIDLVAYAGTAAVVVDLSGGTDTAKRRSETDTLTGIEGAIGSKGNDTFKGDANVNLFQGDEGKDTAAGGLGCDLYNFNAIVDSKAGTPPAT